MDSYHGIARHYDEIFPLTPAKLSFVRSLVGTGAKEILDIGCATGTLARTLAGYGHRVCGIDLDEEMIAIARERSATEDPAPEFRVLNMLDLSRSFSPGSFDMILCLGNTLPHLAGREEIAAAVGDVFGLLTAGGSATFQIVNFHHFVGAELPAIERGQLRFTRRYEQENGDPRIRFITSLETPEATAPTEDDALLYPLSLEELHGALRACGFTEPRDVAGYDSSPVADSSPGFICSAEKP